MNETIHTQISSFQFVAIKWTGDIRGSSSISCSVFICVEVILIMSCGWSSSGLTGLLGLLDRLEVKTVGEEVEVPDMSLELVDAE